MVMGKMGTGEPTAASHVKPHAALLKERTRYAAPRRPASQSAARYARAGLGPRKRVLLPRKRTTSRAQSDLCPRSQGEGKKGDWIWGPLGRPPGATASEIGVSAGVSWMCCTYMISCVLLGACCASVLVAMAPSCRKGSLETLFSSGPAAQTPPPTKESERECAARAQEWSQRVLRPTQAHAGAIGCLKHNITVKGSGAVRCAGAASRKVPALRTAGLDWAQTRG